jgi:uncharacterized membrane protein
MTWGKRFALRQSLGQSLWLIPLLGAVAGAALAWVSVAVDDVVTLPLGWTYTPSASESVLTTVSGAMIGLIGFVVTVTVLMVQTATGTFSARYLRLLYRSGMLKLVLAELLGTFAFSYVLLRHAGDSKTPEIGVALSGLLVLVGLMLFLLFFSRFLQRLRPVVAAASLAALGAETFLESVSPQPPGRAAPVDRERGLVVDGSHAGVIQAYHVAGLVDWAERHNCTVALRPAVGDFVGVGAPLFEVRGGELPTGAAAELEGMVALGEERTIEQDPAFAIRVMVDIANRALSPAVNDPTTAVQVLNYLEELLLLIGRTDFSGRGLYHDAHGSVRLIVPARGFEDYLALGLTEIRQFGSTSIQVLRRLRALLQQLGESCRPEHRQAVDEEVARLDETAVAAFGGTLDIGAAADADTQGLGGPGRSPA